MLGHVSGMADYDTLNSLLPKPLLSSAGGPFRLGDEDYLTKEEYYNLIKSLPLEHQPDTQQAYSNFAYFLLSELVAKVSGMSMREYTTKYMFEPLGMHNTFFADDMREIVLNRAEGYRTFKNSDKIINDRILRAVYCSTYATLWSNYSGVMLGQGELWFNKIKEEDEDPWQTVIWKINNKPSFGSSSRNDSECFFSEEVNRLFNSGQN